MSTARGQGHSEILSDEKKETAAGFWKRAHAFSTTTTSSCARVLTDNGNCYRSHVSAEALGLIAHKRTRPYPDGKVCEDRNLLEEWAYAHPYRCEADRAAAFPIWLHHYNHHRGHTALRGKAPITRLAVTNLCGQYS